MFGATLASLIAPLLLVLSTSLGITRTAFTPRDESPEEYAAGAGPTRPLCLHRLPQLQARRGRA